MKRLEDMTEPELKILFNAIARSVQKILTKATGIAKPMFVLLAFDDPKISQYVSSCERTTMIEALYEAARRLDRKEDVAR